MEKRRYLGLARVSSREQEREGFSLEVQEEALQRYARQQRGEIVKLFRIAETATRPDERKTFGELLDYARQNARDLAGVLFFKVDRAARNLFDYVELERLELDYGLEVIYVTQPTENTPAGRMMRRTLANMASFYTEQQSLDVKDGLQRRVQAGLFVGRAPYGYRNVRVDGRGLVEVHPQEARNVRRVFELYANGGHSLDSLAEKLRGEGLQYAEDLERFPRSKLHTILRDRSYLGEIPFKGIWRAGAQEQLIDRSTWDRVQVILGAKMYQTHELIFASELIECGECGHPVTGERKTKQNREGKHEYVYYRCSRYNRAGHPRHRISEAKLEAQAIGLFRQLRIPSDDVREWFRDVIRAKANENGKANQEKIADLSRQLTSLREQKDRLLNLRLLDEIDANTFSTKSADLRDRTDRLSAELKAQDRKQDEMAELAEKVFELSQTLEAKWLTSRASEKRRLLQVVCLNLKLDGATLLPTMRKPFDVLAEGLSVPLSRGDRI